MTHSTYSKRKRIIHTGVCVAIAALCYLSVYFFVRPLAVRGESMLPAVRDGQLVAMLPVHSNPFLEAQRGDVVVVHHEASNALLIKRLIAVPGDTLQIRNNCVYVNGVVLDEPYIAEPMVTQDVPLFTLGEDMYYVLGDNRNISADSRRYGTFTKSDIRAVVDLEHQVFHWALIIILLSSMFVWAVVLPDWDTKEESLPMQPATEAA